MQLFMDVVGSCNLRCPSCPVGNIGPLNKTGLIELDLFRRLVEKADREYQLHDVCLVNWAEPLLHPQLPQLIGIVKERGLHCTISSNLNVLPRVEEILKANPDVFRISLSGFTQEVYGQTHRFGNVERVKSNMRRLSEAWRRTPNVSTQIHVFFHKYRHNLQEAPRMRAFAESLGFGWKEDWALYQPYEGLAALAEGTLAEEQRRFVRDLYALPVLEALAAARAFVHEPCPLLEEQIVLDFQGNLLLCCGVYDFEKNRLGSFLDMTPVVVESAKKSHPTCARCSGHGIHQYFMYPANQRLKKIYDNLAAKNLQARRAA